jgi:hypothetical protein
LRPGLPSRVSPLIADVIPVEDAVSSTEMLDADRPVQPGESGLYDG